MYLEGKLGKLGREADDTGDFEEEGAGAEGDLSCHVIALSRDLEKDGGVKRRGEVR